MTRSLFLSLPHTLRRNTHVVSESLTRTHTPHGLDCCTLSLPVCLSGTPLCALVIPFGLQRPDPHVACMILLSGRYFYKDPVQSPSWWRISLMTLAVDGVPMVHHYSHARGDIRALKRKIAASAHLEDEDLVAIPRTEIADVIASQRRNMAEVLADDSVLVPLPGFNFEVPGGEGVRGCVTSDRHGNATLAAT